MSVITEVSNDTRTADIKRVNPNSNVVKFAKMASDGRRKGRGVTRKEVLAKHGFDCAPYVKMYQCFKAIGRGRYIYTGNALKKSA